RAERAVNLEGDEVVAIDARDPAHVDMGDDAALEAEGGVGGVVGRGLIFLALLVETLGDIGVADADYALDLAKEVVEHVTPVADHVEDDAAAVFAAVIPRRALRFLPAALEHPVTELAAHREHAAEEAGVAQEGKFFQAGQKQLVLHGAVLEAFGVGKL